MLFILLTSLFFNHARGMSCTFKSHDDLSKSVLRDLENERIQCPSNKVHLTFDDGPHETYTPQIRRELNLRGVKGSFFITTTTLDGRNKNGASAEIQSLMQDGHLISNHGYNHDAYALRIDGKGKILSHGYSEAERLAELTKSTKLLNEATGNRFSRQKHRVFRFPYGRGAMPSPAEIQYLHERGEMKFTSNDYGGRLREYRRQSPALISLSSQGFDHLAWNHDSRDSSYPNSMPSDQVLMDYIKNNLKDLCKSSGAKVSLFHDLKAMNTKAIGPIIDVGRCLGLNFVTYNELARSKNDLSAGVLITKEDVAVGTYQNIEAMLGAVQSAGTVECEENQDGVNTCYSQATKKSFNDCEGSASICYQGKWYGKDDPYVVGKCMNRCYSEYTKKYYGNCEGEGSVCLDGKWHPRGSAIINFACK